MGHPSSAYAPKAPAQGVLYQVVRDHVETFRTEAARERDGLPRFNHGRLFRSLMTVHVPGCRRLESQRANSLDGTRH